MLFSVGATYGSRFSIWDLSKSQGGKPLQTGISFPEGGHQFRYAFGSIVFDYRDPHIDLQDGARRVRIISLLRPSAQPKERLFIFMI